MVKIGWALLATCMILLLSVSSPRGSFVAAQSPAVSRIYISPVSICCSGSAPVAVGDNVTFNVMVDLVAGQSFNGFDIRINYTNPASFGQSGTLQAESISYSNNVFANYNHGTPDAECIDGISLLANGRGCATDDLPGPGQVHLAEGILTQSVPGPFTAGLLFSITFKVMRTGISQIYFDRWNLVNVANFNPTYVPLVIYSGIFGNQGLVAFFNYSPFDPTVSVSIIPGQPVVFDGSGSVDALNSSLTPSNYSWNFGDAPGLIDTTSPAVRHTFALPGNYSVRLVVVDDAGRTGSIARTVSVVPALGSLFLTVEDQSGTVFRGNVVVEVFNSSAALSPFVRKTVDLFGQVEFKGLAPGTYHVSFSGSMIVKSSRAETISPGWTTRDTVLLTIASPPPDYSWLLFVVPMAGGLGIVTVLSIKKRNTERSGRRARGAGKGFKKRQA